MFKKLLILFLLTHGANLFGQSCPNLLAPLNGDIDVPVDSTISWEFVEGVTGYIISIGTTSGGTDIIDRKSVGSSTTYNPPVGLPDNRLIYVTITLFFFDQPDITCPSESFRTEDVTTVPVCTSLSNPLNGAINVNGATNIVWNYAPGATSYQLLVGTSSGAGDIIDQNLGNVLSYNPPGDLPSGTQFFVTVIPSNEIGPAAGCLEESFTTGAVATLPGCATMITPADGAINVPLTPFLEWTNIADATGYRVTIGNSPFTSEILDNVTFFTNSTYVINFEPNKTFFIKITPFNAAGEAIGCVQESFSTILGCGPYFDSITGELVTINPQLNFPDIISICSNEVPSLITTTDVAEGYKWFKLDQFGNETLISSTADVLLSEQGDYRYEAYNTVSQSGNIIECPTLQNFKVEISEIATITLVDVSEHNGSLQVRIETQGDGDYEYAINKIEGPYQSNNVFENVPEGSITVYVKDKNGCGVVEKTVEQDLTVEGFPKFFTPNGDGVNDFWQVIPSFGINEPLLGPIFIFDRFGALLSKIEPTSKGWDGNYDGKSLPSSDYWFKTDLDDGRTLNGHFALKR